MIKTGDDIAGVGKLVNRINFYSSSAALVQWHTGLKRNNQYSDVDDTTKSSYKNNKHVFLLPITN